MNDRPNPNRPYGSSSARRKAPSEYNLQIRKNGKISQAGESWWEHLLDIGRNRGLDCFVEDGAVKALFSRTVLIRATEKEVGALFFYPIQQPDDFDEAEKFMNELWPLTDGGAGV